MMACVLLDHLLLHRGQTGPREHGGYDAGWTDQVASVQLEIANPGKPSPSASARP
jgi:hypothetical protein